MTIRVDRDQNGNFYIKQTYFFGLYSINGYISIASIKGGHTKLFIWNSKGTIIEYCQINTEEELYIIIKILKNRFRNPKDSKLKFTKFKSFKMS